MTLRAIHDFVKRMWNTPVTFAFARCLTCDWWIVALHRGKKLHNVTCPLCDEWQQLHQQRSTPRHVS